MKILLWGIPGYAAFEAGKKFLQLQGIFHAATYILVFVAPVNILINWALCVETWIWLYWPPIAAAFTNNVLSVSLFLYVVFIDGKKCWNGFTTKAFQSWGVIFNLALPGFLMMEAEYLAFEVLTVAASHLSSTQLAAQSILSPLIALTFQGYFALSIVSSMTIAGLIGAGCTYRARAFAKVSQSSG